MENTIENKARFFAQYWGQEIFRYVDKLNKLESDVLRNIGHDYNKLNTSGFLELKNLSDITDEDAIEVAKIIEDNQDNLTYHIVDSKDFDIHVSIKCVLVKFYSKHPGMQGFLNYSLIQVDTEDGDVIVSRFSDGGIELEDAPTDNAIHVYDFLRDNGFLIPFNGSSIQELISYGWAKTNDN